MRPTLTASLLGLALSTLAGCSDDAAALAGGPDGGRVAEDAQPSSADGGGQREDAGTDSGEDAAKAPGCQPAQCPAVAHATAACIADRCDFDCEPGFVRRGGACVEVLHRVSAGDTFACAIRADDTLTCWGKPFFTGIATPPAGKFRDVSVSATVACGVKADGTAVCWGGNVVAPGGTFRHVAAGQNDACGLRTDDTVVCWSQSPSILAAHGLDAAPAGPFRQVVLGNYAVALRADGTTARWGSKISAQQTQPPAANSRMLAMAHLANGVGVSLMKDRSLQFWGSLAGRETHPAGVQWVSLGYFNLCTVLTSGEVGCALDASGAQDPAVPKGVFREVAAFNNFACAIRTDGKMLCWGKNDVGQASPPGDPF